MAPAWNNGPSRALDDDSQMKLLLGQSLTDAEALAKQNALASSCNKVSYSTFCNELQERKVPTPDTSLSTPSRAESPLQAGASQASAAFPPVPASATTPPASRPAPAADLTQKLGRQSAPKNPKGAPGCAARAAGPCTPQKKRKRQSRPSRPSAAPATVGAAPRTTGEDEDLQPLAALGAARRRRRPERHPAVRFLGSGSSGDQMSEAEAAAPPPPPPHFKWQLWEEGPSEALPRSPAWPQEEEATDEASTELLWSSSLFARHLQNWLQSVQVPADLGSTSLG